MEFLLARYITSTGENKFPTQIARTFGSANSGPRIGPIVINEIRYKPLAGEEEFIEFKNISSSTVKLHDPANPTNTWRFSGVGFNFSTNAEIASGGLFVLSATDPIAFRTRNNVPMQVPVFGPYSEVLQDNGELLQLERPDAPDTLVPYILVDDVQYSYQSPWPTLTASTGSSLERINPSAYGNDPINWRARLHGATPGFENDQNLAPFVDAGTNLNFVVTNFPSLHFAGMGSRLTMDFPRHPAR